MIDTALVPISSFSAVATVLKAGQKECILPLSGSKIS